MSEAAQMFNRFDDSEILFSFLKTGKKDLFKTLMTTGNFCI